MRLKADPLEVFRDSDSPIALHVRKRWMNGAGHAVSLAAEKARQLQDQQSDDGSWDGAVAPTIQNLFALWLLNERRSRGINKALDWLLETSHPPMDSPQEDGATYSHMFFRTSRRDHAELRHMAGVPFTSGCSGFVKTGAALFFAAEFGRAGDDRVEKAFASIAQTAKARHGRLCSGSCGNNIHLALAAHPKHSKGPAMAQVVSWLGSRQQPSGSWDMSIPFFATLWAISHVDSRSADAQFRRALARVQQSQNRDGSWGRGEKLLDTFLVLDSLAQKGIELGG